MQSRLKAYARQNKENDSRPEKCASRINECYVAQSQPMGKSKGSMARCQIPPSIRKGGEGGQFSNATRPQAQLKISRDLNLHSSHGGHLILHFCARKGFGNWKRCLFDFWARQGSVIWTRKVILTAQCLII